MQLWAAAPVWHEVGLLVTGEPDEQEKRFHRTPAKCEPNVEDERLKIDSGKAANTAGPDHIRRRQRIVPSALLERQPLSEFQFCVAKRSEKLSFLSSSHRRETRRAALG